MGLDLGSRTCGVALSDALLQGAFPREIIRRDRENKIRPTLARIEELVVQEDVRLIVLGLPVNMDGSEGRRAQISREFAEKLSRRTGLPVELCDERLTTVEADEIMEENGVRGWKDRKQKVDQIAAAVILQDYMNSHEDVMERLKKTGDI